MDNKLGHLFRLPLDDIKENIYAEPQVSYTNEEIMEVLNDLYEAGE